MNSSIPVFLVATLILTLSVSADDAFTVQGRLTDASGNALDGATVDVTATIFSLAIGGTGLQSQSFTDVEVRNGVFSVTYALQNAAGIIGYREAMLKSAGNAWVELTVTHDEVETTLAPRQKITPVPFAQFSISNFTVISSGNRYLELNSNGIEARTGLSSDGTAGSRTLFLNKNGKTVAIGKSSNVDSSKALDIGGDVRCKTVTLDGGADIAEPFNVNATGRILPGMVVSIDPENLGEMRLSSEAYDTTVAGIISGAKGINPAMTLSQTGSIADGEHPVALTGRVWCYCDAAENGPIGPGDLLTTSSSTGHAMKATDRDRAFGATIGKAMSSLDRGTGMVLVLVRPQ